MGAYLRMTTSRVLSHYLGSPATTDDVESERRGERTACEIAPTNTVSDSVHQWRISLRTIPVLTKKAANASAIEYTATEPRIRSFLRFFYSQARRSQDSAPDSCPSLCRGEQLPDLVHLHNQLTRGGRILGVAHAIVDLDVELARVVLALPAMEHALDDGALRDGDGLAEEEHGLLPVRGHRCRPGAEARHARPPAGLERVRRAHAPRLVRPPAEWPHLGEDRVALLDDVHGGVGRDGLAGGGEEGVEVENESVHFDAPRGGGDELEGGSEVELLGSDVTKVEILQVDDGPSKVIEIGDYGAYLNDDGFTDDRRRAHNIHSGLLIDVCRHGRQIKA